MMERWDEWDSCASSDSDSAGRRLLQPTTGERSSLPPPTTSTTIFMHWVPPSSPTLSASSTESESSTAAASIASPTDIAATINETVADMDKMLHATDKAIRDAFKLCLHSNSAMKRGKGLTQMKYACFLTWRVVSVLESFAIIMQTLPAKGRAETSELLATLAMDGYHTVTKMREEHWMRSCGSDHENPGEHTWARYEAWVQLFCDRYEGEVKQRIENLASSSSLFPPMAAAQADCVATNPRIREAMDRVIRMAESFAKNDTATTCPAWSDIVAPLLKQYAEVCNPPEAESARMPETVGRIARDVLQYAYKSLFRQLADRDGVVCNDSVEAEVAKRNAAMDARDGGDGVDCVECEHMTKDKVYTEWRQFLAVEMRASMARASRAGALPLPKQRRPWARFVDTILWCVQDSVDRLDEACRRPHMAPFMSMN